MRSVRVSASECDGRAGSEGSREMGWLSGGESEGVGVVELCYGCKRWKGCEGERRNLRASHVIWGEGADELEMRHIFIDALGENMTRQGGHEQCKLIIIIYDLTSRCLLGYFYHLPHHDHYFKNKA